MAGLVDDLLDVARISRGKIRLKSVRLELNELLALFLGDESKGRG